MLLKEKGRMKILRQPLIAGNWKMHKTTAEAWSYIETWKGLSLNPEAEVLLLVPYTCLHVLQKTGIKFGAQNLFWEMNGAFTGEISAPMLVDLGCEYVLVGHSERRQILKENDDTICLKIKAAISGGLKPVLCVGETLEERNNGQATKIVGRQLEAGLKDIPFTPDLVIAYEPVW
ncbi:MAG: triose-phosphate isomerase family protein, partial [Chitinophagales bacterium]